MQNYKVVYRFVYCT